METIKRNCNNCSKEYLADMRNIKRGWGLACNKSCAASLREKSKPGYNPERVERNNLRREVWNYPAERGDCFSRGAFDNDDYDPSDDEYHNGKDYS